MRVSGIRKTAGRTVLAIGCALIGSAIFAGAASATNYDVTVTTDDITVNGNCTLREAVQAANNDAVVDGCAAGVGQDFIILQTPGPYQLTIPPDGTPNDNADGDLDVGQSVQIGAPIGEFATIEQTTLDRIFHHLSGTLDVGNVLLTGGAPPADGGAILATSTLSVDTVEFEDNTATGGGAIAADSSVSIENADFFDNHAVLNDGGALKLTADSHLVQQSSFNDNDALSEGGAIYLAQNGSADFITSTFVANEASEGAAIYVESDSTGAVLQDSTIAGNEALAGGAALTTAVEADLIMERTILAYNTDTNGPSNCGGPVAGDDAASYNLVDVNDCSLGAGSTNNLLNVDPQLAPAGFYGGFTVVRPPFVGSPAIDAIPLAECGSSEDQHETPRPVGGACDIGAFEGSVPRPPVVTPPVVTPPVTTTPPPAKKKCKKGQKLKKVKGKRKCVKKKRKK